MTVWAKMTDAQKARAREVKAAYLERNRAEVYARKRRHYMANRDKYLAIERARVYKKLYGISVEDYDRMFAEQGGKCAI